MEELYGTMKYSVISVRYTSNWIMPVQLKSMPISISISTESRRMKLNGYHSTARAVFNDKTNVEPWDENGMGLPCKNHSHVWSMGGGRGMVATTLKILGFLSKNAKN